MLLYVTILCDLQAMRLWTLLVLLVSRPRATNDLVSSSKKRMKALEELHSDVTTHHMEASGWSTHAFSLFFILGPSSSQRRPKAFHFPK